MKKVLITGVNGYIAQYLLKYRPADKDVVITGSQRKISPNSTFRPEKNIHLELLKSVAPQLGDLEYDIMIHTAAMASPSSPTEKPEQIFRINGHATGELANWCTKKNVRLIYLSTDIVFSGKNAPYSVNAIPHPQNIYGQSKFMGEENIREAGGNFAIARLALVLGRSLCAKKNFIDWFEARLMTNETIPLFYDEIRTPVIASIAAKAIWALALGDETGTFHICGSDRINRMELGYALCSYLNKGTELLKQTSALTATVPRPEDASLVADSDFLPQELHPASVLDNIKLLFDC